MVALPEAGKDQEVFDEVLQADKTTAITNNNTG
jgi:hypothetical protein